MKTSSFRSIILPALLAASAVFAVLTLPVASAQASGPNHHRSAPMQRWIALAASRQNQGLSIRYIGFAILASTAVGIGTAEVLRSQRIGYHRRQSMLKQAFRAGATDILEPPVDGSWSSLGNDTLLPEVSESAPIGPLPPTAPQDGPDVPSLDWDALQLGPLPDAGNDVGEATLVSAFVDITYPTCRIQTPAGQRLTAISINGAFYSFYRLSPSRDALQRMVESLHQSGQAAVVTPSQGDYVLWLYQPEAKLATQAVQAPAGLS
jgi:hypothetical protein